MTSIVPDKEKLIEALAYQALVSAMDKNAVHRALVSSAPGAMTKPVRTLAIHLPGGRTIPLPVGDANTPAPIEHETLRSTMNRLHEAITVDGELRDDWADVVRAMTL